MPTGMQNIAITMNSGDANIRRLFVIIGRLTAMMPMHLEAYEVDQGQTSVLPE